MMGEAVKLDPQSGKSWGLLGLTQMRAGEEEEGMKALVKAGAKDKFNVQVYNTLNLYEKTIPASYTSETFGPFRIRYPKAEKPMLERYAPKLMGDALASMKSRYGFVPDFPIFLEFYESREHFSVRTSGLPNIGIQGVCFGRMVATMSPHGEVFNWGNVVWHELGHVFAIQLSKNHVPRWFTEGLSEYETIAKRPEWSRELDPQLYQAIQNKTLPKVADMNRAFTHAEDGNDMTVAYYAASQILVFTVERFGMPKVVAALRAWGEGLRTPQVIERAFGVSPEAYDQQFREWYVGRNTRYAKQFFPSDKKRAPDVVQKKIDALQNSTEPSKAKLILSLRAELGLSKVRSGKLEDGIKDLEAVLKDAPEQADAHFSLAKIAVAKKDLPGARAHLDAIIKAGGDGYSVQMALAEFAEIQKDVAGYKHALESAHRWDPSQPTPLRNLFDLAKTDKREDDELSALVELAPLEQHDPSIWRGLVTRLVAKNRMAEASKACDAGVFVDLNSTTFHNACAKAKRGVGNSMGALFEAESATLGEGKPEAMQEAFKLLAELATAAGDKAKAEAAAKAGAKIKAQKEPNTEE
jgi:cellulose synthase operon protein C